LPSFSPTETVTSPPDASGRSSPSFHSARDTRWGYVATPKVMDYICDVMYICIYIYMWDGYNYIYMFIIVYTNFTWNIRK
jgi:hypothetical protein